MTVYSMRRFRARIQIHGDDVQNLLIIMLVLASHFFSIWLALLHPGDTHFPNSRNGVIGTRLRTSSPDKHASHSEQAS